MQKKAAFELSMTTVVIIVLAMIMLALGLTLVRTIFKGAIYTATTLNDQIKNEINKIFEQGSTVGIVSEAGKLEPDRGKDNCVWWAILAEQAGTYSYKFTISPEKCAQEGLSSSQIENWFTGLSGTLSMAANQKENKCLLITPPETAPSCVFTLNLEVKKGNVNYGSSSVYIRPKRATLFG